MVNAAGDSAIVSGRENRMHDCSKEMDGGPSLSEIFLLDPCGIGSDRPCFFSLRINRGFGLSSSALMSFSSAGATRFAASEDCSNHGLERPHPKIC